MLKDKKIAIIGSGTMCRVIAGGLLKSGKIKAAHIRATCRRKDAAEAITRDLGISCQVGSKATAAWADVIILAIKPKDLPKVLEELRASASLGSGPLIISIAAGVSTAFIEKATGYAFPVIRAMPNTPCLIGKGMTVVCRGNRSKAAHVALAREIFIGLGRFIELDEKHMDTVTGLSGSGPAFMYVIIEALADGGVMRGLSRPVAVELAAQMTLGAAEMVLATGRHPASLRDDVTTPAGCTIAGILALEDGRIRSVLARGVETASKVAAELAEV